MLDATVCIEVLSDFMETKVGDQRQRRGIIWRDRCDKAPTPCAPRAHRIAPASPQAMGN